MNRDHFFKPTCKAPREKKERVLEPPPDGEKPEKPKGNFRETMWFMDALDEDALSKIETEDIRDRSDKFKDDGRQIDKDVRAQFSLAAGEDPGRTKMKMARQEFSSATGEDQPASGGNATLFIVVGIVLALAAAGYFLLT